MNQILDLKELVYHIIGNKHDIGGYEICGIAVDGGLLCPHCIEKECNNIIDSIEKDINDQWKIVNYCSEAELEYVYCDHCHKPLGYHDD